MPHLFLLGIVLVQAVAIGNQRVAVGQPLRLASVVKPDQFPNLATVAVKLHRLALIHLANQHITVRQRLGGQRVVEAGQLPNDLASGIDLHHTFAELQIHHRVAIGQAIGGGGAIGEVDRSDDEPLTIHLDHPLRFRQR